MITKNNRILIDFEFNGLPRFNFNSEISQIKIRNLNNRKEIIRNFKTEKPNTAGAIVVCGGEDISGDVLFSKEEFIKCLNIVNGSFKDVFIGFGIETDRELLKEKGIFLNKYADIQDCLRLSDIEYEMSTEGCSLEACYFLAFNEILDISHSGTEELDSIERLYSYAIENFEGRDRFTYFPYGWNGGDRLENYVFRKYRMIPKKHTRGESILTRMLVDTLIDLKKEFPESFLYDDYFFDW